MSLDARITTPRSHDSIGHRLAEITGDDTAVSRIGERQRFHLALSEPAHLIVFERLRIRLAMPARATVGGDTRHPAVGGRDLGIRRRFGFRVLRRALAAKPLEGFHQARRALPARPNNRDTSRDLDFGGRAELDLLRGGSRRQPLQVHACIPKPARSNGTMSGATQRQLQAKPCGTVTNPKIWSLREIRTHVSRGRRPRVRSRIRPSSSCKRRNGLDHLHMVSEGGLEPPRPCGHQPLKLTGVVYLVGRGPSPAPD